MTRVFLLVVGVLALGSIGGCGDYTERNSERGPDSTSFSPSSNGSGSDGSGSGDSGTGPSANTTSGSGGGDADTTETATTGFFTDLSCDIPSTPCGGDVVGTWAVDCPLELDGHVDVTGLGLGCSYGETTSGHLQVAGSLTLDDMGNFEDNTTTIGEHVFELPETCLQTSVASCKNIARALPVTGYATATCIDNTETGGCTCSGTFDRQGGLAVISQIGSVRGWVYSIG